MNTKSLALLAVFASLYGVLTILPFSAYIGGPGFITCACFLLPVMALLLDPAYAFGSGLLGATVGMMFGMGYPTIMPIWGLLIPAIAAGVGSYAFRKRNELGVVVLILEGLLYLRFYNFQASGLFLVHYVVAILLGTWAVFGAFNAFRWNHFYRRLTAVALTAMVENAMLNVGSILILALPAELWVAIAPVSIMERVIILVVSMVIIEVLRKSGINYIKILIPEAVQ